MRRLLLLLLPLAVGCSIRTNIATIQAAFTPPETPAPPKLPPTPTFLTTDYTTTADQVTVRLGNVCKEAGCAYQLFKFRSDEPTRRSWTDCGTAFSPRKNGDAETDPQDASCTPGTNSNPGDATFTVTLEQRQMTGDLAGLTPTRIAIRTRDADGLVSEEAAITVQHDETPPPVPSNLEANAGNGSVILTWTRSNAPDVKGYKVYYGTSPVMTSVTELNSKLAANGPSPIFVPGRDVVSVALANLPNGQTFYASVTAVDGACKDTGLLDGKNDPVCADNESPLTTVDGAVVVSATPGEFSVRAIGKYLQPSNRLARAVAVQGDLVVLASTNLDDTQPKTIVETFDLATLTKLGTEVDGSMASARLGIVTFDEAPLRAFCRADSPGVGGPKKFLHAQKRIQMFGRYAFVASGTGFVHAVDLTTPTAPTGAWENATDAATPEGCALGIDVQWPHLLIADGVVTDNDPANDDAGGLVDRRLSRLANGKLRVLSNQVCLDDDGGANKGTLDTAQSVAFVSSTGTNALVGDGGIYVGTHGRTRFCSNIALHNNAFCSALATCPPVTSGGSSASDVVQLRPEMPIMLQASRQGRIIVGKDAGPNFDNALDDSLPIDMQGQVLSITTAGRYAYAAVAGLRGVDVIDLKDEEDPKLVGNLFTDGDARDVAIAGPYVVIANDPDVASGGAGLLVYSLAQTFVLVNSGSRQTISTVNAKGLRSFLSDHTPDDDSKNFFQQSLRGLAYTPIPVESGLGVKDLCFQVEPTNGVATCGRRALASIDLPDPPTKPCVTQVSGSRPIWPPRCFPHDTTASPQPYTNAPTTVKAMSVFGNELLFAYTFANQPAFRNVPIVDFDPDGWVFPPAFNNYIFANAVGAGGNDDDKDAAFAPGRRDLSPAPLTLGAALPSFGALTAVQTDTGVRLLNRDAGASDKDLPELQGAAFGAADVCGVRFRTSQSDSQKHAYLSCFDFAGTFLQGEIDLGPSNCTSAAVARAGQITAIELIRAGVQSDGCEGVVIVDATANAEPPMMMPPPEITKLTLNTHLPNISIEGDNVYVSCLLPLENLCQLRLRR